MKIALVRRGYSASGGAERYLRRFASALREAGHECALFSSEPWPDWPHEFFLLSGKSPRAFADALASARPREKCDRVFSLERVWECDCYRAGDGVHRVALAQRAKFEPGLRTWLRKFSAAHREILEIEAQLFSASGARSVIANSQMVKNEIVREYQFPAEKIAVIFNGLPPEKFLSLPADQATARLALGLAADEFVALFVGSGWERKGLRFAMRAIEQLPRATLLVAGTGKKRDLPSSSRTKFLGPVTDLAPLFAAADVFVLPTVYEPFSNACLEAAAAGLPVVTTIFNGFAEILPREKCGKILSDPSDSAALAEALEFWRGRNLREEIAAEFRPPKFSIERNVAETLAWLGHKFAQ